MEKDIIDSTDIYDVIKGFLSGSNCYDATTSHLKIIGRFYFRGDVNGNVAVTWPETANEKLTYTKTFTPLNALNKKFEDEITDAKFEFENDQEGYMVATWTDKDDPTITVRYKFRPFKYMAKEINGFLKEWFKDDEILNR